MKTCHIEAFPTPSRGRSPLQRTRSGARLEANPYLVSIPLRAAMRCECASSSGPASMANPASLWAIELGAGRAESLGSLMLGSRGDGSPSICGCTVAEFLEGTEIVLLVGGCGNNWFCLRRVVLLGGRQDHGVFLGYAHAPGWY